MIQGHKQQHKRKGQSTKTSTAKNPPPQFEETKDETKEEVATHLGGVNH